MRFLTMHRVFPLLDKEKEGGKKEGNAPNFPLSS